MTDNKSGLHRPAPPVDLFTLEPEPELVAEGVGDPESPSAADSGKDATPERKQRSKAKKKTTASKPVERIKTTVELEPETLDLISDLQSQHKRQTHRHLPMWKIIKNAIQEHVERKNK